MKFSNMLAIGALTLSFATGSAMAATKGAAYRTRS